MPVGLGNAIRWLKKEISTVSIDEAEADVSFVALSTAGGEMRELLTARLSPRRS